MRALLILILAIWPALSLAEATNVPDTAASERGDLASARASEIAKVLMTSPALMKTVINNTLRENPDVVKTIIRDTLLRNPEIVVYALQEFQKQRKSGQANMTRKPEQSVDEALLEEMRSGKNAPVDGNSDGTVTITEFIDYNCVHCRRFAPVLDSLMETNDHLRVVYRQWPILGQDSVDVARIALAARFQDGFKKLHDKFLSASGPLNADRALEIAGAMGLDTEKLEDDAEHPDVTKHISRSIVLAKTANFKGTPSMLIGNQLARGAPEPQQIQRILDQFQLK